MKNQAVIIVTLLLLSVKSVSGEPVEALAERFVTLLRYDRQIDTMHEQCLRSQSSVTPESLVARRPDYFDGLTQSSPQWPAIVSAFSEYQRQICSRPTKGEVVQALSAAYAKVLTAEQLQESIEFYSSNTGRALIEANQQAADAAGEEFTRLNSKYASDLTADLSKKIRALSSSK
jgi:hypothetical protein